MKELPLNRNNPCAFIQPFLVFHFKGDDSIVEWKIDVNGEIDKYIRNWSVVDAALYPRSRKIQRELNLPGVFNWLSQATPLLKQMMKELSKQNREVDRVYEYTGSAGPTHILRNGALFERVSIHREARTTPPALCSPWPDIKDYIPQILGKARSV